MHIVRKKTREITVGNIKIGADNPVIVQSMLKNRLENRKAVISEVQTLQKAGCEIIRTAIYNHESLYYLKNLLSEKSLKVPVVADIHFDYMLAIGALEAGAHCVRINPGNIGGLERLGKVIMKAKEKKAAVRIGVNSGSVETRILKRNAGNMLNSILESVAGTVEFFENMHFYNFKISAKASSVMDTIGTYEAISSKIDYPLHIGVTEAGPLFTGSIKSSLGIGILLSVGIGDTVRVSLTGSSELEVKAAYAILSNLEIRKRGVNIISCPTCGRTRDDLEGIVKKVENMTAGITESIKIAVMGCVVNGPGEAKDADIGIACGIKKAAIFKNGKIIKRVDVSDAVFELENELKSYKKLYN